VRRAPFHGEKRGTATDLFGREKKEVRVVLSREKRGSPHSWKEEVMGDPLYERQKKESKK